MKITDKNMSVFQNDNVHDSSDYLQQGDYVFSSIYLSVCLLATSLKKL